MTTVGILAYGSVVSDPREEIECATVRKIASVLTPFKVEFARTSSKTRSGAPTVVPVEAGGAQVRGCVFVVSATEAEASDMLYRRETGQKTAKYVEPKVPGPNTVLIRRIENFEGVGVVVYTHIASNIPDLSAQKLAALAIESARQRSDDLDGINYLIQAKANGIRTALSDDYEAEIKSALGVSTLEEALVKIRSETLHPSRERS